jgi:hypothetical protein
MRELTAEAVKTVPAERYPTIWGCQRKCEIFRERAYCDVVDFLGLECDDDDDGDDAQEHVDQSPPCEVGELALGIADDGADKGYQPGEL